MEVRVALFASRCEPWLELATREPGFGRACLRLGARTPACRRMDHENGYNGGVAWAYESNRFWPFTQVPMQDMYTAETAVVGSCP